jgi:hypothetical protein
MLERLPESHQGLARRSSRTSHPGGGQPRASLRRHNAPGRELFHCAATTRAAWQSTEGSPATNNTFFFLAQHDAHSHLGQLQQ